MGSGGCDTEMDEYSQRQAYLAEALKAARKHREELRRGFREATRRLEAALGCVKALELNQNIMKREARIVSLRRYQETIDALARHRHTADRYADELRKIEHLIAHAERRIANHEADIAELERGGVIFYLPSADD